MKSAIPYTLTLSLAVVGLAFTPSAEAINYTWNNTGTDWNSDASWNSSSGTFPNAGGDLAIFSSAAVTNPNLSTSASIARMTANSSTARDYILTSSNAGVTLTLGSTGSGTASAINYTPTVGNFTINAPVIFGAGGGSTQNINVNSASSSVFGNVIINGAITTSNQITLNKSGTGWLTLSNASNAWSGNTQVSEGTLALSGSGTLGSGDLQMNGGTFDISAISGGSYSHSGALTGTGSINGGNKGLSVDGLNADVSMSFDEVALTLAGTSTFDFTNPAFTAGTFDAISGTSSSVDFSGTLELNFSGGTYNIGASALIFDLDSYSGNFSSIIFTGLDSGQAATFDPLTGTISIVPEPSTYAMLLGSSTLMVLFWRRRKN